MPEVSISRPDAAPSVDRLTLRTSEVREFSAPSSCTCCYGAVCFADGVEASSLASLLFSCMAEE